MILIIGGAYQGKFDYVRENFGINEKVICDFHLLILEKIREGIDTQGWIEEQMDYLKDKIIICEDISCGLVPMEEELRAWREAVGRATARIAGESDKVIRLFCGIGTVIK